VAVVDASEVVSIAVSNKLEAIAKETKPSVIKATNLLYLSRFSIKKKKKKPTV
jgi:hypothetical protein